MSKTGQKVIHVHHKLVEACKKNDRKAQTRIYDLYYKSMFNISQRIVHNNETAEDIMQEAFLAAFTNIKKFSGEVTFGAWLKRIVINRSIDYLKKKKLLTEEFDNQIEINEEAYNDEDITKHKIQQIHAGISRLPEGYRVIMTLHLFEGYDHDEIAQILDIKASTSRSQYTRAKVKLLHILKD